MSTGADIQTDSCPVSEYAHFPMLGRDEQDLAIELASVRSQRLWQRREFVPEALLD